MKHPKTIGCLSALLVAAAAHAQHQPYAGEHTREIKSLSQKEVEDLRAGAGMGYAKAAELNSFPGPMHVLELADKLQLSAGQRAATKQLMGTHKAEARAIGARRVDAERAMEVLFRSGKLDQAALAKAVRGASALEGEYRLSHLETHRRMRALLTGEQVARYDALRGYGSSKSPAGHKHQ
jgi:Spy/CpxP family protein refolding chaperone